MLLPATIPGTGQAALLLVATPQEDPKLRFVLQADVVQGLTVHEERRALAPRCTVEQSWAGCLPAGQALAFRNALLTLGQDEAGDPAPLQPILCPFWPAERAWSEADAGLFAAALQAVWEPDGSACQVFTGAPSGYTITPLTRTAPVLWGRFDELPDPDAITDEMQTVALSWIEEGAIDYALDFTGAAPTAGPVLHSTTWPLLPFAGRFTTAKAGGVTLDVTRKPLGFGRVPAESFYPQKPRRKISVEYQLTPAEGAALLRLWAACAGPVAPFWAPALTSSCRLAVDAAATDTTITVTDAAALLGHAHLHIGTGADTVACRITGVAGNVLTLDAALGFAAPRAWTVVQPLLFARFSRPDLSCTWGGAVHLSAELTELPTEYGSVSGEPEGENLGGLPPPAWCYHFTDDVQHWYRTSYAAPLTLGGQTYTPHTNEHGQMTERLNLDPSDCPITVRDWPGSPFARYRLERNPAEVTLTIYEGVPAGGALTAASAIWAGRIRSMGRTGPVYKFSVGGFSRMLDELTPRWLLKPTCSTCLFSSACGLVKADWTFTVARSGAGATAFEHVINTISWRGGAALPALAAHYFAGGYIVRPQAGKVDQLIAIADSTAISGGALTLTLKEVLAPAVTGAETWSLLPGCDLTWPTCRDKFGNTKFRGFPAIPSVNPSITVESNVQSGGKKG